ncbi:stimulated by retinoic acid gene 6 protein-like [Lytechinus pictus]|uniref:stimulated by retinoic acid gene 6 protein-like n=1 Tax=Lytechinus pictus TaxID=7653 RepID=UPI0030B9C60C
MDLNTDEPLTTSMANGSEITCDMNTTLVQFYWIGCNIAPSIILLLLATFCRCKTNSFKCIRRPKLIYPVNLLDGYSNRLPYVFAFLVTSNVVIVLLQLNADNQGWVDISQLSEAMRFLVWALIKYMCIVIAGLVFYPLLVCITYSNFMTDVIGLLFTCNWFSMYIYIYTVCPVGSREGILNGFRYMPALISCFGLASYFLWRIIRRLKRTCTKWKNKNFNLLSNGNDDDWNQSHYLERVKYLLRPNHERHGNVKSGGKFARLMQRIYPSFKGFRYSTRILCTVGLSLIVLYQMSLIYITQTLKLVQELVLDFFASSSGLGEFFQMIELAFHLSSYPAICISLINCLLLLQNYRENTRDLWMGNRTRFQTRARSPHSIIVSCLKFSSLSVAYTFYGFLVLQVVLWAIMSFVVIIIENNLLIELLRDYWSHIFVILLIVVIQQLLARFVLLKRNTNGALVIDNRHLFHIVVHFFFFLNIIVGLLGSILRIIKVTFIGILLIGRVDLCLAPRGFEWADKGFKAYRSFLQLEVSLTHPVVVTFCHLLNRSRRKGRSLSGETDVERGHDDDAHVCDDVAIEDVVSPLGSASAILSRRVRNRWLKAYTLIRNKRLVYERLHKLEETRRDGSQQSLYFMASHESERV